MNVLRTVILGSTQHEHADYDLLVGVLDPYAETVSQIGYVGCL